VLLRPDSHDVYLAFAAHWGLTSLPTQPRTPQEKGKPERSGGYVKSTALKGRRFNSLDAQNAFLRPYVGRVEDLLRQTLFRRQGSSILLKSVDSAAPRTNNWRPPRCGLTSE
jgi:hypothetical protein